MQAGSSISPLDVEKAIGMTECGNLDQHASPNSTEIGKSSTIWMNGRSE
jgi:hypothetical protein